MSMIAKKILDSSYITRQDLMKHFSLTKRQIDYSLDKINDWLAYKKVELIQVISNEIQISKKTHMFLELNLFDLREYSLSVKERMLYTFLMLISGEEFLSINHFIDVLDVSKSSFVKDLKELEVDLSRNGVNLVYSRKQGYYLEGEEGQIRSYLIRQMMITVSAENNHKLLDLFIEESKEFASYAEIEQSMMNLLKNHHLNFATNRLREFIYSFIFLQKRLIAVPHYVPRKSRLLMVENAVEFQFAKELIQLFNLPEPSIGFLSMWLLGMTEIEINEIENDHSIKIDLVEELLLRFEYLSGIFFENRELVKKQIYQHFRPAHYRLLFNIPIVNPLLMRTKEEYNDVFIIVKEALKHYEAKFQFIIPDDEIAFLTIHFASLIQRYQTKENRKIIAAVTCPNGVGSSMILYTGLQELFLEFDFVPPITHMDLKPLFSKVDIIFSTTRYLQFIPPEKSFIVVNPIMNDAEKLRLKKEVYLKLGKAINKIPDLRQVMNIIEKHVDKEKAKSIECDLRKVVFDDNKEYIAKSNTFLKIPLHEIIKSDFIQLNISATNRVEAIKVATTPLLKANAITESYVNRILSMVEQGAEYMVIAKHVAMPHGKVEDGSLKLGMGITVLENPVEFGNIHNDPVKYIFTLSVIDKESHLLALSTLVPLLSNPDFYRILDEAVDGMEILEFIENFERNIRI